MASTKISAMGAATLPLAGTEVVPIVQGGLNKKATVAALQGSGTSTQVVVYDTSGLLSGTAHMTFGSNVLTIEGVVNGLSGIQLKSTSAAESYVALAVDGGAALSSNTGTGLSIYASGDCDLGEIGVHVLAFTKATGVFTFPVSVVSPVVKSVPVTLTSLGSAVTAGAGARAFISDGLTLGTWGSAAVGGGVVVKPVFSNGAAWLNG